WQRMIIKMSTAKKRAIQAGRVKTVKYKDWLQNSFKENPTEAIEHLNAMLEVTEEPQLFLRALGDVAKARGIGHIAEATGLNREGLYDMLSEKGNPCLSSLLKVLDAMGLRLIVEEKV